MKKFFKLGFKWNGETVLYVWELLVWVAILVSPFIFHYPFILGFLLLTLFVLGEALVLIAKD